MDPDEALKELRELAYAITLTDGKPGEAIRIGQELAEKFESLDDWIVKGGFLPKDWKR